MGANRYISSLRCQSLSYISYNSERGYPKFMKELGEELTGFWGTASPWVTGCCPAKELPNERCKPLKVDCCPPKMLPSGEAGGEPTTPKVVKEAPWFPLLGWEEPKLVKEAVGGELEEARVCPPLFWPKMVNAWLVCPPACCLLCCCCCWPKVVKAWFRCKLVPKVVKDPVVLPTGLAPCPCLCSVWSINSNSEIACFKRSSLHHHVQQLFAEATAFFLSHSATESGSYNPTKSTQLTQPNKTYATMAQHNTT